MFVAGMDNVLVFMKRLVGKSSTYTIDAKVEQLFDVLQWFEIPYCNINKVIKKQRGEHTHQKAQQKKKDKAKGIVFIHHDRR